MEQRREFARIVDIEPEAATAAIQQAGQGYFHFEFRGDAAKRFRALYASIQNGGASSLLIGVNKKRHAVQIGYAALTVFIVAIRSGHRLSLYLG